jgi:ABC-type sugar transport system ATPase subunit
MTFLAVTDIGKRDGDSFFLRNINFIQRKLQNIAIAGETGSGKSTLLKIIAGLSQADSGHVVFKGSKVTGPEEKLVPGHTGIAYLSQHFELPKSLRVEQVLDYANTILEADAQKLFAVCQIDHLLKRRTDQLSGGEKQRIAIARLLIGSPELLLLDEPFSHLDLSHKNILKQVIDDICQRLKITCTLVSHDPADILSWADQIIVLRHGEIIQKGKPEKLYSAPIDTYVGGLLGDYNFIPPDRLIDFKLAPSRRGVFIRPEQIKITRKKAKGLKGVAEQCLYFGDHWRLHFIYKETKLTAKADWEVPQGEVVHFAFPNSLHYLHKQS